MLRQEHLFIGVRGEVAQAGELLHGGWGGLLRQEHFTWGGSCSDRSTFKWGWGAARAGALIHWGGGGIVAQTGALLHGGRGGCSGRSSFTFVGRTNLLLRLSQYNAFSQARLKSCWALGDSFCIFALVACGCLKKVRSKSTERREWNMPSLK